MLCATEDMPTKCSAQLRTSWLRFGNQTQQKAHMPPTRFHHPRLSVVVALRKKSCGLPACVQTGSRIFEISDRFTVRPSCEKIFVDSGGSGLLSVRRALRSPSGRRGSATYHATMSVSAEKIGILWEAPMSTMSIVMAGTLHW